MSAIHTRTQSATLNTFIEAWKSLSTDNMAKLFAPDFEFYGLPAAVLGAKQTTSEEWAGFVKPLWAELSNFRVCIPLSNRLHY
jgi:hypothetical protein